MTKTRAAFAAMIGLSIGALVASACTVHSYSSPPPSGTAAPAPAPAPAPTTPAPVAHDPCAGKQCGAACSVCDPNDKDCVETAVLKQCSAAGKCEPTAAQCGAAADAGAAYNPCAGKQCGERCRICAPGDMKCIESALIKLCHPDGQCKEATTVDCSKK
jgi:hypothetical protein